MARLTNVTGMTQVLSRLRTSKLTTAVGVQRGLKKAGHFLQRKSQQVAPVDTGNLKGGAFTRNVGGTGFATDIIVGYVADYAVYVHENLQAKHKTGKQAKYLEQPARDSKNEIFGMIASEAKI